jgi:hypothetical protein
MALPFEFLYPIIHGYVKAKGMPGRAIRRQVNEAVRKFERQETMGCRGGLLPIGSGEGINAQP